MPRDSTFTGGHPPDDDGLENGPTSEAPAVRSPTGEQPVRSAVTVPLPQRKPGSSAMPPVGPRPMPSAPPPPAPLANPTPPVPPPSAAREPARNTADRRPPSPSTAMRQAYQPSAPPRFFPPQPRNLADTGLSQSLVEELILKALFFAGELRGGDLAHRIRLPSLIVDEVMENLRKQKFIELKGGGGLGMGKSNMVFHLTTYATDLIKQIQERNRYNGPAPVRLEDWFEAVAAQTVRGSRINRAKMEDKFGNLVVSDYIYDGLGPAMNSGRAIFFFGAPGNGKTAICQSLIRCYEGDIYVPHALLVDDFIIRVFDETLHEPRPEDPGTMQSQDARWVRCARPMVVVGGELTLETLDLIWSSDVKYYEAPFQLKATNGMLLIDDFGRQKVSPKDLLNRWIVPLENDVDYLTLHTGKKLKVPFDVFTAFSTNLDPADLVDDAFLRRVRYKLEVQAPDEDQFHQIFDVVCRQRGVAYDANLVQYLIDEHYTPHRRPFAACQPRDLIDQMIDIAHYRGEQPRMSRQLVDSAVANYFVRFKRGL